MTLPPIIMEVENGEEAPIFRFHDYGTKIIRKQVLWWKFTKQLSKLMGNLLSGSAVNWSICIFICLWKSMACVGLSM